MTTRATVVKIENQTVWLAPGGRDSSCEGCARSGCSGCAAGTLQPETHRRQHGKTPRRAFPAENPLALPVKEGSEVKVSSTASRTAVQLMYAVVFPAAAAVAAYCCAPAGKAGGMKAACALAAFALASALVTAVSAAVKKTAPEKAAGMKITEIVCL